MYGDYLDEAETAMSINEGVIDRVVRVLLGLVGLAIVFVGPQTLWGLIGIVPLITGVIGVCPLYSLLGINTCSLKK